MPIRTPSADEIRGLASALGLSLRGGDAESYRDLVAANLGAFSALESLEDDAKPPPQRSWQRPSAAENPLGAWYVKTRIEGAQRGKLAGRSVALKDNVLLAGVPLMNGTSLLEGYVPGADATIVTRLLDAGATIAGKAVCEAYCFSGGSHTSATGPVHNPIDLRRTAGGSSSGSAALVAAGEVDLAIGGDQGGSIRMPASFCGIVGLKPTHGLVPYTRILSIEPTLDHAGPMTRSVRDNALLLEVLAGADGLDTRQIAPQTAPYTESLAEGVAGLRIGVLREGFGQPNSEADVEASVRAAAQRFEKLGAQLGEVSVPLHRAGGAIGVGLFQSALALMFHADGVLLGREDPADLAFVRAQRGWRERVDALPETVKLNLLLTSWVERQRGFEYVARAQNQIRPLRSAYDAALEQFDVLLLPTTPMKAPLLPAPSASREQILAAAFAPIANTIPFDVTHHPALSIPCGLSEGLPVGMMLIGRHWQEATLYRAAQAFEAHADWRKL